MSKQSDENADLHQAQDPNKTTTGKTDAREESPVRLISDLVDTVALQLYKEEEGLLEYERQTRQVYVQDRFERTMGDYESATPVASHNPAR